MRKVVMLIIIFVSIMGTFIILSNVLASDGDEAAELIVEQPDSGSIRGFIRFGIGEGHPLEGVTVKFGDKSMVTGMDGFYSFNKLPPGEERMYFFKDDYYHIPQDVAVNNDTVIVNINMFSEKYIRDITGLVRNFDTGKPVSGAEVILGSKTAVTDKDGIFKMEKVPFSGYRFEVKHKDYHSYDSTGVVVNDMYKEAVFSIKPGKAKVKWIKAKTYQLAEENYHWTLEIKTGIFDHTEIKEVFCTGEFYGNKEKYELYCEHIGNGVYSLLYKGSKRYQPEYLHVIDAEKFETIEEIYYDN